MLSITKFILVLLFFCLFVQAEAIAMGQESESYDEILKLTGAVNQNLDNSETHKNLGIAYAEKGMLNKALEEFEKAMRIEYGEGYKKGKEDAIRNREARIYGRYLILSITGGLFIAAVIVSILSWSDMSDSIRAMRKKVRINNFAKSIKVKLAPELRERAIGIAQKKEKLREAIGRETDSNLREAASSILPKLDDLARQAALLLELQQNLSDYVKDIDPGKLGIEQRDCEEKLRRETDEEARRALDYQLKQIKNKQTNYSKAGAKIRTCDAVLSGIAARIDATSLDLMSLPSVLIRKQEFFERISVELDDEINLTRDAAETVMEESAES